MTNSKQKTRRIITTIRKIGTLANSIIVQKLSEHGIEGLVPSHGDILVQLFTEKEISMKNLAARINKKKNTVTTLINKLIQSGYVQRTLDMNDHRVSLISLTKKAGNLKKDFEQISDALLSITYKGFSEKEKNEIIKYLDRIVENLCERKAQ